VRRGHRRAGRKFVTASEGGRDNVDAWRGDTNVIAVIGLAVEFTDVIPPAATISAFPPGWVCFGGPPATCGLAPPAIPAGGSIVAPISVTIPLAPLEAAGCAMPNTATITGPVGSNENFFAGDDADTATADAFLFWDLPDGTTIVTCDPTNLKTTKVAKGDCVASGGNYRCDYVVTVTNMGKDPYHGPIKLSEHLGFAPNSVVFSAPWGCTGGGASYHCTKPHVDLEKGQSVELTVTATVPDGPQCKLKNSAVMTFPTAPTRFNGDASDDAASATAKIPSKNCVKPDRPQCTPGPNEFRSESGACVCKSGYIRDEKGHCVGVVEAPRCPDGKPVPKSGHCPETPPQCEPGQNELRNDQGQCVCKSGYERDKNGRCVAPTPQCIPGPNEQRNAQGQCVCKSGYERDKNGRCVAPTSPADECRKKDGVWDGKRCLSRADVCKAKGWNWDGKSCQPPSNPADECRKKGWVWDGRAKTCSPAPNPADECTKKGWLWDGKNCQPPPSTVPR
jgi:hypothetical protein